MSLRFGVRMANVKHEEGDWFAIPLTDGGFALGIVARTKGAAVLGYFFGPRRPEQPTLADATSCEPSDAVLVGRFSDLGIKRGEWPLLGRIPGWQREAWPIPVFVRHEELSGRSSHVFYDPDHPGKRLRDVQIGPDVPQGPEDGMMGAGFVEERLSRLLA